MKLAYTLFLLIALPCIILAATAGVVLTACTLTFDTAVDIWSKS